MFDVKVPKENCPIKMKFALALSYFSNKQFPASERVPAFVPDWLVSPRMRLHRTILLSLPFIKLGVQLQKELLGFFILFGVFDFGIHFQIEFEGRRIPAGEISVGLHLGLLLREVHGLELLEQLDVLGHVEGTALSQMLVVR